MYRIVLDEETDEQIDALPYEALRPLAECSTSCRLLHGTGTRSMTRNRMLPFVHGRSAVPGSSPT
jgi:hypothetical protein